MINIVVPMAGKSRFFEDDAHSFPKPLLEIDGRPMIEHVVECLEGIGEPHQYVFIINAEDADRFHLDNVLQLVTNGRCVIVRQTAAAKGAACSVLLAIEHIDNDNQLIISNADQVFAKNAQKTAVKRFRDRNADAGVVCFSSVHPQWSYARTNAEGFVVQTAEKNPLSRNAIAGLYYFRRGTDFVRAAMASIRKGAVVNEMYYIAPTLNELILENKRVDAHIIDNADYTSFYSPQRIADFVATREATR